MNTGSRRAKTAFVAVAILLVIVILVISLSLVVLLFPKYISPIFSIGTIIVAITVVFVTIVFKEKEQATPELYQKPITLTIEEYVQEQYQNAGNLFNNLLSEALNWRFNHMSLSQLAQKSIGAIEHVSVESKEEALLRRIEETVRKTVEETLGEKTIKAIGIPKQEIIQEIVEKIINLSNRIENTLGQETETVEAVKQKLDNITKTLEKLEELNKIIESTNRIEKTVNEKITQEISSQLQEIKKTLSSETNKITINQDNINKSIEKLRQIIETMQNNINTLRKEQEQQEKLEKLKRELYDEINEGLEKLKRRIGKIKIEWGITGGEDIVLTIIENRLNKAERMFKECLRNNDIKGLYTVKGEIAVLRELFDEFKMKNKLSR